MRVIILISQRDNVPPHPFSRMKIISQNYPPEISHNDDIHITFLIVVFTHLTEQCTFSWVPQIANNIVRLIYISEGSNNDDQRNNDKKINKNNDYNDYSSGFHREEWCSSWWPRWSRWRTSLWSQAKWGCTHWRLLWAFSFMDSLSCQASTSS